MEIDVLTEKLAPESRVNYSKLVTVEHNVKVYFIGRIVAGDMDTVDSAVDQCLNGKVWMGPCPAPRYGDTRAEMESRVRREQTP